MFLVNLSGEANVWVNIVDGVDVGHVSEQFFMRREIIIEELHEATNGLSLKQEFLDLRAKVCDPRNELEELGGVAHKGLYIEDAGDQHQGEVANGSRVVRRIPRVCPVGEDPALLIGIELQHGAVKEPSVELSNLFVRALEEVLINDLLVAELSDYPFGTGLTLVDVGLEKVKGLLHCGLVIRSLLDGEVVACSELENSELVLRHDYRVDRERNILGEWNTLVFKVLLRNLEAADVCIIVL